MTVQREVTEQYSENPSAANQTSGTAGSKDQNAHSPCAQREEREKWGHCTIKSMMEIKVNTGFFPQALIILLLFSLRKTSYNEEAEAEKLMGALALSLMS